MDKHPRVAVVDDDPVVHSLVSAALAGYCDVLPIESGEAALTHWAPSAPQAVELVLLDVGLPGLDGYDVCRRLRAAPGGADVPVLFLSGHAGIDERLRGYAAGGDDYLVKPFAAAELRVKVQRALRVRQHQSQMAAELAEMTHAAMNSVDMLGDAAVVLDFQRDLAGCHDFESIAEALLKVLARFDLEGCVRLRGTSHSFTRNLRGEATALESSILDHLTRHESRNSAHALGLNVGWQLPNVLLFVRGLVLNRPGTMDRAASERMGRLIDAVAMLVQAANTHAQAVDASQAVTQLAGSRRLVQVTRDALADISARELAQRASMRLVFEELDSAVEDCFISLGLSAPQEDHLSQVIRSHCQRAEAVLDSGHDVQESLRRLILQLESPAP